jgi:hypothetical protein
MAITEPLLHGGREQGLTPTSWQPDRAGAFAANFVVVAVYAPIVEELTFAPRLQPARAVREVDGDRARRRLLRARPRARAGVPESSPSAAA